MELYLYHTNDPRPIPENNTAIPKEISRLVEIPDASVNKITLAGSYFAGEEQLLGILKKIRHNGILIICGPDIFEISRSIISGYIDGKIVREIIMPNELLYSLFELNEIFSKYEDFEIINKRINHYRYSLTVRRK